MSSEKKSKLPLILLAVAGLGILGFFIFKSSSEDEEESRGERAAAVAVAPIEHRPIELRRVFSGALEAHSKFVVAPKVAGRVKDIPVDISDVVQRGDTVVMLDAAEFDQAVRQAEADLAVAEANLAEAKSSLEITLRADLRTTTLRERGIASETEYDNVQAELLARQAQVKVAEAQVIRAESSLESARIRLSYTSITADWSGDEDRRVVAERYVDEGETVSANEPLLMIVELDPITAVIYVTERDYGSLQPGQVARFSTDAFPNTVFEGQIDRISPIFRENSRQARVELSLSNPDHSLKPGMFVRANITLDRVEEATVIPYAALARRGSDTGTFIVSEDSKTVRWHKVKTGIRSEDTVQILEADLDGRVVVLGQHLLDDGSTITIPDDSTLSIEL
ncbi:efflux RND transporter periplasmic adaptor subunit [Pelagicoccus sp. SDUM812002]|uniref:efflux RND transporter periplasmic adaptor subunit n=1 Tax=Pelagicoccus sp. SDUM812002 TaxID=3041266 RepID=UPI00280C40B4|nr:efflux RND transporter periplasmic adaptor subunit [Pelagicoccus sp. SDUM812002]MDQ8184896.1 efflux RND transporter periplasmic adaptor subunit [Pelagicoccus sp. SDUM812002]